VAARRELLRGAAAVLLILTIGGGSLLWGRLSHWLTVRDLRNERVVLVPEGDRLVEGDDVRPLEYGGGLDAGASLVAAPDGSGALIRGWAYGPPGAPAPEAVLVFVGPELVGVTRAERPSPGAFARSPNRDVRALVSGFLLWVEPERVDLSAPVTVVALRPKAALARELPALSDTEGGNDTIPARRRPAGQDESDHR
jgi:hypothetical protein